MRVSGLQGFIRRGLMCFAALLLSVGACRAQRAVPGAMIPTLPGGAIDSGPLPAAQVVTLTVYLAPPAERASALDAFLTALQQPGSAQYHQWMTPAGFAQSFGAYAGQIADVTAWAAQQGLQAGPVSASGTSIALSGTATQMEAAFGAGLHVVELSGQQYVANTAVPAVPDVVAGNVLALDGLSTVPGAHTATLRTETGRAAAADLLTGVAAVVEANASRLLSVTSNACVEDVDTATVSALHLLLKEAAAEGITTLASSGCNGRGAGSFPGSLAETVSVAAASGVTPSASPSPSELRPDWQSAPGLPQDGMRHEPDLTVSSLADLESAVLAILARQPVPADGSAARLGNIAGKLYSMTSTPGLYTQPDGAAQGTWEAATGLGLVDVGKLAKSFPNGTAAVTVAVVPMNGSYSIKYGDAMSYQINIYGFAGTVPDGTVTVSFAPNGYTTAGPIALVNGAAVFTLSQLTTVPVANTTTYTITVTYNGDTVYTTGTGSTALYVGPQPLTISASTVGSPSVGGTYRVNVGLAGGSGSPTGSFTITPTNTTAQTVNFTGTNGQVSAFKDFIASQAGTLYITVDCVVDSNYTCYSGNTSVTVAQATPSLAVKISPNPVLANQSTTLTATITSAGGIAPSGQVVFTDANNATLCTTNYSGAITGDVSCTTSNLASASGTVTGTYPGDTNYLAAKGSAQYTLAQITTKVTLNTISSPVVANTPLTLTANLSPATTLNGQPPTGTIAFFDGTTQIGLQTLGSNPYTASVQVTLTSQGTHTIYTTYSGDTNYKTGTSDTQSVVVGPASAVVLTATPTGSVTYGNIVTLNAAITATPTAGATALTGSLKFNISGTDFTTQTVALTNATATTATAVLKVTQALSVGTYTVNLYCVNADFDCSNFNTGGFTFNIVKADTTTTLQLNPSTLVGGTSVTATAIISPTLTPTGTSGVITGTVTFYDNATNVGTFGINGNQASATFTLSTAGGDNIVAVYNGDGNNNSSKSTGSTTGTGTPPATTVTAVSASTASSLAGAVVTLTANVVATPAAGSTTAGSPTGTVFFYSTVNGTQFLLGSASLGATGLNSASAVLPTTALRAGADVISAAFQGSSGFLASSTTANITVQISDYTVAFTPASLSLNAGQSGSITAAVNAVNGFTGTVTLGCTAPAGDAITCAFDKTTLATSGLATLTVATTTRSAAVFSPHPIEAGAGAVGALLLGLLLAARRRRGRLLSGIVLLLFLGATLGSTIGCTNLVNPPTGSGLGSGTPAGTLLLTITTSGTQGTSTVQHIYQITLNVQ